MSIRKVAASPDIVRSAVIAVRVVSPSALQLDALPPRRPAPLFPHKPGYDFTLRKGGGICRRTISACIVCTPEAGLSLRRRKCKHCVRVGQPLRVWTEANQAWALDFVHDAVESGQAIRVLNVMDAHTQECLPVVSRSDVVA